MDGKDVWRDDVFVERLWKSVKYEAVFLYACETVFDAKVGIWRCVEFYNAERPRSNLGKRTPDEALAALPRAVASTSAAMIEGERHVA